VRNNAGLATPAIARRQVEEPAGSARRTAVPLRHTGFIAPSRQPPTTCVVMLDGPATSSQRRGSSVGSRCPQQGRKLSAARREAGASGYLRWGSDRVRAQQRRACNPAIARRQVEEPAGSARRTAVPLRHTGFIAPSRQPPTTCVVMLDGPATSSQRRGSSVGSRCPQQGRRLSAARREAGASGGIVRHNASSVGTAPGPRQLTRNRPDVGQTRPAAVQPGLSGGHLTRSR